MSDVEVNDTLTEADYEQKHLEFSSKLKQLIVCNKKLYTLGKELDILYKKNMKDLRKTNNKMNKESDGFEKKVFEVTDELANVLNIDKKTRFTRAEISQSMNAYIRENDCRDEVDRTLIKPNEELVKLFKLDAQDKLTFFNLHSFLRKHYFSCK